MTETEEMVEMLKNEVAFIIKPNINNYAPHLVSPTE